MGVPNEVSKDFWQYAASLVSNAAASSPMTQMFCTYNTPLLATARLILVTGGQTRGIPSPISATEIGAAHSISC